MELPVNKKIYFASDAHLGLYPRDKSHEREKLFVKWLDEIKADAAEIYLLGDIFDYWYEYKRVVPRGFVRFLGKLAEIADSGIKIHFFIGNHDIWVFDYLPSEIGLELHKKPFRTEIMGKRFLIDHGDRLTNDWSYILMNNFFRNRVAQFFFSKIHPNYTIRMATAWSKHSRYSKGLREEFLGEDKEHQIIKARKMLQGEAIDFFVFGHRHLPMDFKLNDTSRLINTGDWVVHFTYAVFDGKDMQLKSYSA
jgi:UDP-2,3-diacylglucosamine hydrolase